MERVGGGAYSDVYRVMEVATRKILCGKRLKWNFATVNRWKRETEALEKLHQNEHVVQIVDGWLDPDNQDATIIMEYCSEGTVEQKLLSPESFVWQVIFQTAFALVQTRIVHLDLKPENLLLTKRRGKILTIIGDWGEANCAADLVGTKLYMAPELWGKDKLHSD